MPVLLGIKRIYERAQITDGTRILIDRLWPRGVKKSVVNIDLWLKEVAPSNELRKWFSHEPSRWEEFRRRYRKELEDSKAFAQLLDIVRKSDVTLLYSSKEPNHNNAVALAEFIKEKLA